MPQRATDSPIWTVEKIWPNSTVYIIGGGPSLVDINLNLIKDKNCIGVNSAYILGEWIDVVWFGDKGWWRRNSGDILNLNALKIHCSNVYHPDLKKLKRDSRTFGITTDPTKVIWNKSSGGSAINLAYHFGAKKIVLLGFDMRKIEVDGELRHNWHKYHPHIKGNPYHRFLKAFKFIQRDAEKLGIEILNATPKSAIKEFPIVELEEIVGSSSKK